MKTSKPFSTISYNTPEFLTRKLGDLYDRGLIGFYAFIEHYPEEDEKKKHIHLLIIPDGQTDTKTFSDLLVEIDLTHPDKPLKCLPWQSSKFGDWYLYTCHDTTYLASKGQKRKYHYDFNDFKTPEEDYLLELVHTIDRSRLKGIEVVKNAVDNNIPFSTLVSNGQIPIQQINQYEKTYDLISSKQSLFRDDRLTHTPLIDVDTGEIVATEFETKILQVAQPLTEEEERLLR